MLIRMKRLNASPDWPESWRQSHAYDLVEVWDAEPRSGYTTAWRRRHALAVDAVRSVTPLGGRVLDVAAAQGNFTLALAEAGYRVTWNDIRAELAEYVKLKAESGEITYAPGNILEIEAEEPFDTVLMTEVIEHVAHPDEFLAHVATLVRPGGHVVLTTPNGEYFRNGLPRFSDFDDTSQFEAVQFQPNAEGHIFLLHRDEMQGLTAQAGLRVLRHLYFINPLTNGHVKLGKLLPHLPRAAVDTVERATSSPRAGRLRRKAHTQMMWVLQRA
jgi:2-polyprenyl-6-hydroxyphenyl methylase/3-demethylubiquinone-9 3-methyltransferase